jgi:hypothetical protein
MTVCPRAIAVGCTLEGPAARGAASALIAITSRDTVDYVSDLDGWKKNAPPKRGRLGRVRSTCS